MPNRSLIHRADTQETTASIFLGSKCSTPVVPQCLPIGFIDQGPCHLANEILWLTVWRNNGFYSRKRNGGGGGRSSAELKKSQADSNGNNRYDTQNRLRTSRS